jgi:hypothetical protein
MGKLPMKHEASKGKYNDHIEKGNMWERSEKVG